ncbi:hypothetical protein FD755_019266 [Muntiacus reevesi]|uniref:Uncharacterized protein n=1 Tax=Muntiacus reevesi TaxID=9886 RepID=A0A5N3X559_MUNRE|nr:hypothetical protein FD755_019266 [Muntiacus reevesi]
MELNTWKTSESEEGYSEEEESEECQALSKADYNTFRNRVLLYTVAKKIPKKIVTPAERDVLEVGRRKKRQKQRTLAISLTNCKYERLLPHPTQWCGVREPRAQAVTQIYRVSISSWFPFLLGAC